WVPPRVSVRSPPGETRSTRVSTFGGSRVLASRATCWCFWMIHPSTIWTRVWWIGVWFPLNGSIGSRSKEATCHHFTETRVSEGGSTCLRRHSRPVQPRTCRSQAVQQATAAEHLSLMLRWSTPPAAFSTLLGGR